MWRETKNTKSLGTVVLALILVIVAIGATIYVVYLAQRPSQQFCQISLPETPNIVYPGYTPVCGVGTVSYGGLSITVRNYYFAMEKDINFSDHQNSNWSIITSPYNVYMLMNISVFNAGNKPVLVGVFHALVYNANNWIDGVTNTISNATFSFYPHYALQNHKTYGGTWVQPNSRADMWVIFYVPFPRDNPDNIKQTKNFTLAYFWYAEQITRQEMYELIVKV